MLPDVTALPTAARHRAAELIRSRRDFTLPELAWFNTAPCGQHTELTHGCRRCGIQFRKHQRVGIAWLYMRGRGLIADQVGPQPLDAQVLTSTGYRRMGDLAVGDAVVDPEGQPSEVTGVFPQGEQDVYRLTFSDGTWAESTLGHLWKVRGPIEPYHTRVGREYRDGETWHIRTLDEIRQRPKSSAVPLIAVPPDFQEDILPVDPYLLGLVLGDGHLSAGVPTYISADQELVDAAARARPAGWGWVRRADRSRCQIHAMTGSQPILRELGIFGLRSWEKFVPPQYKWATAQTRLAVLQGLMDTDGNWATGSVEFGSASRQLAQDVADLARSLGLRTSGPRPKATSYTYKGERRHGRVSFRVTMAESETVRVFRLSRKLREQPKARVRGDLTGARSRREWRRDQRVKWIRSVEFVRRAAVQCISVSAPSRLYVTDNWTVTHNTGKTAQAAGLIAACKQVGELDRHTALVVCRAAALDQWVSELERFLPKLTVTAATGPKKQRIERYLQPFDICVATDKIVVNDLDQFGELPIRLLVVDDIDPLRSRTTQTAYAIKSLARAVDRCVVLSATPLQKKLRELHSVLEPVGGQEVFGSLTSFTRRYVREDLVRIYSPAAGRYITQRHATGYQHMDEFVAKVRPLVLRRTPEHIDDVDLPVIMPPHNIHLDLHPRQKERYALLRQRVLKIIRAGGAQVTQTSAAAAFTYGAMICAGLGTLDGEEDGPGQSIKLDWVQNTVVDGDLSEEKVVVFCRFLRTAEALRARLTAAGVGHVVISGKERGNRGDAVRRFWDDPDCRVLIGTSAIEQSLNLQVSRHLICIDQLLNPARMQQIAGRIRRDGSAYRSVYVHNLLARGTQEEGYLDILRREQALADFVWSEQNQLFEALDPLTMLQLIGGSRA